MIKEDVVKEQIRDMITEEIRGLVATAINNLEHRINDRFYFLNNRMSDIEQLMVKHSIKFLILKDNEEKK